MDNQEWTAALKNAQNEYKIAEELRSIASTDLHIIVYEGLRESDQSGGTAFWKNQYSILTDNYKGDYN